MERTGTVIGALLWIIGLAGAVRALCGAFPGGDGFWLALDEEDRVIGCVEESAVLGKAVVRLWPPSSIGRIK